MKKEITCSDIYLICIANIHRIYVYFRCEAGGKQIRKTERQTTKRKDAFRYKTQSLRFVLQGLETSAVTFDITWKSGDNCFVKKIILNVNVRFIYGKYV